MSFENNIDSNHCISHGVIQGLCQCDCLCNLFKNKWNSDAKSRQVALNNFRFKQLKMASRKIMPSITVYFKTSAFNQEAVMH